MPIFEYACHGCGNRFEAWVRKDTAPPCPSCGGTELEKLLSLPRVHSDGTRARSLQAARKRDARLGNDRMHERLEYEAAHDD